jgi:hypothetical protein
MAMLFLKVIWIIVVLNYVVDTYVMLCHLYTYELNTLSHIVFSS